MLGDAVAEREQTVGKVDVFKENVAAELDVGEVPDALYTEGDETVGDLLRDALGHRQHRDGGMIGGAVGVQLVHPANGDALSLIHILKRSKRSAMADLMVISGSFHPP